MTAEAAAAPAQQDQSSREPGTQRAAAIGFLRRRGTERKEAGGAAANDAGDLLLSPPQPPPPLPPPSLPLPAASNLSRLNASSRQPSGAASPAAEARSVPYPSSSSNNTPLIDSDFLLAASPPQPVYAQAAAVVGGVPGGYHGLVSLERISVMLRRKEDELRFQKEAEEANETTFERKLREVEERRRRERAAAPSSEPKTATGQDKGPPPRSPLRQDDSSSSSSPHIQRARAIDFLNQRRGDSPREQLDRRPTSRAEAAVVQPHSGSSGDGNWNSRHYGLDDETRTNSFVRRCKTTLGRNGGGQQRDRSGSGSATATEARDDLDGNSARLMAPYLGTDDTGSDSPGTNAAEGDSFELCRNESIKSHVGSPQLYSSSIPMHVDPSMPMPKMPAGFPVRSSSRPRILPFPKVAHAVEMSGPPSPTSPRSPRIPIDRAARSPGFRSTPFFQQPEGGADSSGLLRSGSYNGIMSPPESPARTEYRPRQRSESEVAMADVDAMTSSRPATNTINTAPARPTKIQIPVVVEPPSARRPVATTQRNNNQFILSPTYTPSPSSPAAFSSLFSHHSPRKFLQQGRAWQVITTTTVKDRYLFLFTDVLVIAKLLREDLSNPEESTFQIKNILALRSSQLVLKDERWQYTPRAPSPAVQAAVRKFSTNPIKAVAYLISKRAFPCTTDAIAHFLHVTPGLSRRQLGRFLGVQEHHDILQAFLDMLHFKNLRVDESLRLFLSTVRLPGETFVIDAVLDAFAKRWYNCNKDSVHSDANVILKLVFAIMELNADLHNPYADEGGKVTMREFVDRFRTGVRADAVAAGSGVLYSGGISSEVLGAIYDSVRKEKLEMAEVDWDLAVKARIVVEVDLTAARGSGPAVGAGSFSRHPQHYLPTQQHSTASRYGKERSRAPPAHLASAAAPDEDDDTTSLTLPPFPSRLTLKHTSAPILVRIPFPDPHLRIHLYGQDLQFSPQILTFAEQPTASFTIRGTGLGRKLVFFSKRGPAARRYQTPFTRQITIEPAFLRHSFQLSFWPHSDELNSSSGGGAAAGGGGGGGPLGSAPPMLQQQGQQRSQQTSSSRYQGRQPQPQPLPPPLPPPQPVVKRKYLFAVSDQDTRASWLESLAAADLHPNDSQRRNQHQHQHYTSALSTGGSGGGGSKKKSSASSSRRHLHRDHRDNHHRREHGGSSRSRAVSTSSLSSVSTARTSASSTSSSSSAAGGGHGEGAPGVGALLPSARSPDDELDAISELVAHRVLREAVLPPENIFTGREIKDAVVKNARVEVVLGFLRDRGLLERSEQRNVL
ncbi:hypothetical protein HDU87_005368 [Geranomyces variabilis]|uniref:SEC7 domain-containing protein n=1 Tax=Geranomyces variabilis TaxID=109894 RepID=A0AAD5XRA7_9FUNG|nr:hypothetical protein HDU87_005368 [Geranomyces variabilis]